MRLPKANAGSSTIFRDEFDAGRFQRLPQFYDCSFLCREFTRLGFKALYCGQRYAGSFG
jgi:hypothetical protein